MFTIFAVIFTIIYEFGFVSLMKKKMWLGLSGLHFFNKLLIRYNIKILNSDQNIFTLLYS